MIISLANKWLLEPDWLTSGLICGIVIIAALISILILRTVNPQTRRAAVAGSDNPVAVPSVPQPARWRDKPKAQKKVEIESLRASCPAALTATPAVASQSLPANTPDTTEGGKPDMVPEKQQPPVQAPGEIPEAITAAPAANPGNQPSPGEQVTAPEAVKVASNVFDIFTDGVAEETEIGKLAAKMNDIDMTDLNRQAQDLLNTIRRR